MVAKSYVSASQGPNWTAVRANGLAYGTYYAFNTTIVHCVESGLLTLTIYRSPDAFKAFVATKQVIEELGSGWTELNKFALEGAICEVVLSMARQQAGLIDAASNSYVNQVIRGVSKDFNHQLLTKVRAVTQEQVQEAIRMYMAPAFVPASSNLVITCAENMKDRLVGRFSEIGYRPKVRTLTSFQDDYGINLAEREGIEGTTLVSSDFC